MYLTGHFVCPWLHEYSFTLAHTHTHTHTHTINIDILEGNSKGIMRVILALAERYQPRSVKQRSVSDPKPYPVIQHQGQVHSQREHNTQDQFSTREHVTPERPPPVAPRTRSPDDLQSRAHNLGSSLAAANSFSVPNMASFNVHARPGPRLPPKPASGRRNFDQSANMPHTHGYGPPQIGQGALSQPERLMRSLEKSQNDDIQTRTFSLSQADMENEVYSTPVDQLPPSAGPRIIAPQKKLGMYNVWCN